MNKNYEVLTDNKDFNEVGLKSTHSNSEEIRMNNDDTFFEDDDEEEDTSFPDEDTAEEDVEVDFEEDVVFDEVRSYDIEPAGATFAKFIANPWPPTAFILTLIGLGTVLLTPPAIWAPNRIGIIGVYALIIVAFAGIVFSLMTWSRAGTHRLRWAGPANIIVIVLAAGVGIADTASWILSGAGIIPALDSPLVLLCFMVVFFSLYTLWMIQKSLDPEPR